MFKNIYKNYLENTYLYVYSIVKNEAKALSIVYTSFDKVFLSVCNRENGFLKITQYMESILTQCNILLANKEKQYKTKISSLIRSFHNLPKVYLEPTTQTLCNIGIQAISEDEAIDYAEQYVSKKL